MDIEKIKNLLEAYKFEELYSVLSKKDEKEIESLLFTVAYDYECLLTYTFLNYAIQKNPAASWHYIASSVMATALNHLTYGYHIAYYHALKAIELAPDDISLKSYILLFYSIPEKLLNKEMALQYAREVYDHDRTNKVARMMLGLEEVP